MTVGTNPNAVSCTSSTFCVEAGANGNAATWNGTSWTSPGIFIDGSKNLSAVSCSSSTFCVAVDYDGKAFT
jgi:hypothetical protein